MRFRHVAPIALVALVVSIAPLGTRAAELAPSASAVTLTNVPPSAIRVSGIAAGGRTLQAVVYATFAPDLPNVLLSRWPVTADADGHYAATISIAPAFFSGTLITVVMQNTNAVQIGRASIRIVPAIVPDVQPN